MEKARSLTNNKEWKTTTRIVYTEWKVRDWERAVGCLLKLMTRKRVWTLVSRQHTLTAQWEEPTRSLGEGRPKRKEKIQRYNGTDKGGNYN